MLHLKTLSELKLTTTSDWIRIIGEPHVYIQLYNHSDIRKETSIAANEEKPYLLAALRVQKCWAEMMLNCKALRAMGVENVAYVLTVLSIMKFTLIINEVRCPRRNAKFFSQQKPALDDISA